VTIFSLGLCLVGEECNDGDPKLGGIVEIFEGEHLDLFDNGENETQRRSHFRHDGGGKSSIIIIVIVF
jgi:hypothetical protein